jgi:hypothetical protein
MPGLVLSLRGTHIRGGIGADRRAHPALVVGFNRVIQTCGHSVFGHTL